MCLLLVGGISPLLAQKFSLSGKLRLLAPTEIVVTTINGEEICSVEVKNGESFTTIPQKIEADVYWLAIGKTKQAVYLQNKEVTVTGYYDEQSPENSSLSFTGLDACLSIMKWIPEEANLSKRTVDVAVKDKLKGNMYSALAYMVNSLNFEANKMLWDLLPENARNTLSARWLAHRLDSLKPFALGAEAYDFSFVNPEGKMVKLSDFRGKIVLVDFWASWCGPCRAEMKNLLPIYQELKGEDLEFISVSLDSREKDWRRMLEEEQLPWIMLWDQEGFVKGNEPTRIQKAYGFYGIPFIVLIDKEGHLLARGIRGNEVREAIIKAKNK